MLSTIVLWLQRLVRGLQDNTGATNANTTRVMEQTALLDKLTHRINANSQKLEHNTLALGAVAARLATANDLLDSLIPILEKIVDQLNPEAVSFSIELTDIGGSTVATGDSPMNVTLPDDTGPKILTLTPKDKKGVATTLDGPAVFASSDTAVATVTPAGDLACRIDFLDTTRPVQIQFSGDARMGPDVVPVAGALDILFTAGEAATLEGTLTDAV